MPRPLYCHILISPSVFNLTLRHVLSIALPFVWALVITGQVVNHTHCLVIQSIEGLSY